MHRYKQHISFIFAAGLLLLVHINALHYLLLDHKPSQLVDELSIHNKKGLHDCDDFILSNLFFLSSKFVQEFSILDHSLLYQHKFVDLVFLSSYIVNNLGRDPPEDLFIQTF